MDINKLNFKKMLIFKKDIVETKSSPSEASLFELKFSFQVN